MLVIGGDSFGVQIRHHECVKFDLPYVWYSELASRQGVDVVNAAVGGADIYSSVFRCVQAILRDPGSVTDCLFFLTDFHRDLLNTQEDMHEYLALVNLFEESDFYRTYNVENEESEGGRMNLLVSGNTTDPKWTYYRDSSMLKAYMASLSAMSQLSVVCQNNDIRLIWVHTAFYNQIELVRRYGNDLFCQPEYEDFVYTDVITENFTKLDDKHWKARQTHPGHMIGLEQMSLLRGFSEKYPGWLK